MYSHSRIETFEQCPRKYKFRYLENLRMDSEGIEAFVGKRVHEALEKLYRDQKLTKLNTIEELLAYYESQWEKNWHAKITIVHPGFNPGHYFALGQQCLADYYKRHYPFNQTKTLGLEERVELKIREADKAYSVQGYIDRLSWDPATETYEIHDYKTGSYVPSQEEADQDRQLALYHLGILQRWPDAKNVKLVWHYLASDREITSVRTLHDLRVLEQHVLDAIHRIEQESSLGRWEVRQSRLCEWCEYKPVCPAFKHPVAMEALTPNEYLGNPGVQLVRTYAALEAQKNDALAAVKKVEAEQKKVQEALFAFAEKDGVTTIDGPEHRIVIKTEEEFKAPRKMDDPFSWELLRTTLKNAGKLEDVSTVNANMLKFAMKKGRWPADLVKAITTLVHVSVQKSVALLRK